jgi:hypothetical protein
MKAQLKHLKEKSLKSLALSSKNIDNGQQEGWLKKIK